GRGIRQWTNQDLIGAASCSHEISSITGIGQKRLVRFCCPFYCADREVPDRNMERSNSINSSSARRFRAISPCCEDTYSSFTRSSTALSCTAKGSVEEPGQHRPSSLNHSRSVPPPAW